MSYFRVAQPTHIFVPFKHRLLFSALLLQLCFCISSSLTRFPAGPQSLLTWSCWRMTCLNRNQWLNALGKQVWGSYNLAMSLSELICLACHCFFQLPLVTAGLVLSCVLIRRRVSHTLWGVPVITTNGSQRLSKMAILFFFVLTHYISILKENSLFCQEPPGSEKRWMGRKLVNSWLWYLPS